LKRSEAEVRDWCLSCLATLLDISTARIDPNAKFTRLGMDSALTVSFVLALEGWLKVELDPEIVFEYPTISQLAKHLSTRGSDQVPQ
jgi:acyl carrier protein